MILIAINGNNQSGKTSVRNILKDELNLRIDVADDNSNLKNSQIVTMSFYSSLKQYCSLKYNIDFHINQTKDNIIPNTSLTGRQILKRESDVLKSIFGKTIFTNQIREYIYNHLNDDKIIIIDDLRFNVEIDFINEMSKNLGIQNYIIHLKGGIKQGNHESEQPLKGVSFNHTFPNFKEVNVDEYYENIDKVVQDVVSLIK